MLTKNVSTLKIVGIGSLISLAFTAVIAMTAANLSGFQIVGHTVPFAYPWRLTEPSALARLTAWGGYLLHNLIVWGIMFYAQREKPKYNNDLRWFNWALILVSLVFAGLHILQTQFFYDGLAQDVPEITALGGVAVMLMFVIVIETPRRGLIFGHKFKFQSGFMQIVRKYHGYFFAWAIIYDYWYHPTVGTWGHLMGFYYNFLLIVQSTLIFNRTHLNKYWTFFLEFFVLIHGVMVAIFQGQNFWPMFAFGFGAMVILTQMYGLGLNTWTKRLLAIGFVVAAVLYYGSLGNLARLSEVIRIPMIDYAGIFIVYGIYLAIHWTINLFQKPQPQPSASSD